jgi:non-specific serine/threonine protein kinase
MRGGEYVDVALLLALWDELQQAVEEELTSTGSTVAELLASRHRAWQQVGRVHLHLALNKADPERPIAFLATVASRISEVATVQHRPLGRAVRERSDASDREGLLTLLAPVQRAAERSPWLRERVESGALFHPARWTAQEAFAFLNEAPTLEQLGLVVRMPGDWKGARPARPQVKVTVGAGAPSQVGLSALLGFSVELALDGDPLTAEERAALLSATDGLALVRGRWVEVDAERLRGIMSHYEAAQAKAARSGLPFLDALRMLAGADLGAASPVADAPGWSEVVAGPWLASVLAELRSPSAPPPDPGPDLHASLRPYQRAGVSWLHFVSRLGLGACLADDMGLGKTIQIIALLLVLRREGPRPAPHLLVVPASLLANWRAELQRFAPSLDARVLHPSELSPEALRDPEAVAGADVVITTYGLVQRLPWVSDAQWGLLVLDEAQAIKNPGTKQTRAVKALRAQGRIALTGTPVENRLSDLWSLFDFVNPGLLGTEKAFAAFTKRLATREHNAYAPLRDLVRPYILRRLKTDRSIVADLPDKVELKAWCTLSKAQAALYEQAVSELAEALPTLYGIKRRGVVLALLMRLKQICNHPSQWLGDGGYDEAQSGKLERLREIAEVVRDKQEKILVFTQFREMTAPLAAFLRGVFGRDGLVLHGETAVKGRKALVDRFQSDEDVPFFVLSLKAGGVGLNLTAASHVVHFDRWWNPAVENQATDRAFRIGQTKNVLVHKLVCRGTVEERIDALIESKRTLASNVLEGGAEALLTEMDDEELLRLVTLDIRRAAEEA